MKLLRRNRSDGADADASAEPVGTAEQQQRTDAGPGGSRKGRPTPKRRDRERRRTGPPQPPPMTRRDAYRWQKQRAKEGRGVSRATARQRMMEGDEDYLMARDKGPVRRTIRDIVDARRGVSSWFFGVALLIVLVTSTQAPVVRIIGPVLWLVLAVALGIDWWLLSRRIRRVIRERFPSETKLGGHIFYGIMRSTQFRRLRVPKPQVRYGQEV